MEKQVHLLKLFGNDLKKLREIKGISLAEISAETRINTKFLNYIESGKFDFQPDTYIRSFLKEYAKAIEEDEKRILSDYDKAKAGFYGARKFDVPGSSKPSVEVRVKAAPTVAKQEQPSEKVYEKSLQKEVPDYLKEEEPDTESDVTDRSVLRKILLGVLIVAIVAGIYFLVDYLNSSADKKSDVKPKSFNEISNEYENKLSGAKDSVAIRDSLNKISALEDSLRLKIKAVQDITVIVVVDENVRTRAEIIAKDSVVVTAAKQFRFSTSDGASTEIYLNGKYLKKPFQSKGSSIKDMLITKEGIATQ